MSESIERLESNVRNYARQFPTVFRSAVGSRITDVEGREYIDFFSAAGSLNYGHNCPAVNDALVLYIQSNGIEQGLDMSSSAKIDFLRRFEEVILTPRDLDYRVQFTGPTGSDSVEAAIKLARKQTGRSHIAAFTNACHGHSLGSLSLTTGRNSHSEFYGSQNNVTHLPFENYWPADSADLLEKMLDDNGSGLPKPAAVILETVQVMGGINVASTKWLRRIANACQQRDIRLIVDDAHAGCGRTGQFFSFEQAGIKPDIVCLSKSIGAGQPMALTLIRRDLDTWKPNEHSSTFRGNSLAFVAATAALDFWNNPSFEIEILQRGTLVKSAMDQIAQAATDYPLSVRGRGLVWGLDVDNPLIAKEVVALAFQRGLLISCVGSRHSVVKCTPPLTISLETLEKGLSILRNCVADVLQFRRAVSEPGCIPDPVSLPTIVSMPLPIGTPAI